MKINSVMQYEIDSFLITECPKVFYSSYITVIC